MLLVSVVIDNYNYSQFLHRSIGAALAQTYPNVHVVVVDDASTDNSADVIRSYADRVTAVLKPTNEGHGAAFNTGFQASRGDIVLFVDADDYLYQRAVETVVAAWEPGVAQIQYRLDLLDPSGRKLDLFPAPELAFDSGDVVPLLLTSGRYQGTVTTGNAFARAALARILPMPAEEFRQGGDGYLVTLAPLFGRVVSIEEPLGAYCQHGANHSQFSRRLAERARWRLQHDAARHRALARMASQLGLPLSSQIAQRDPYMLEDRLVSRVLEPERHPFPNDSRLGLAARAAWSSRRLRFPWRRRAVLAAWFLSVGALPHPLAWRAVQWRMSQQSRPRAITNILKAVRQLSR